MIQSLPVRALLLAAVTLGCSASANPDDGGAPSTGSGGAGGQPAPVISDPEAGFLDVPGSPAGPLGRARMFYSFHPADDDLGDAPLVVFFNGGPGVATSGGLLAFGTGPQTLSGFAAGDDALHANPGSWTRFAHVLYLDPRIAGFSYGLDSLDCADPVTDRSLYLSDAADFARAILEFLDARPALRARRVILAGESWGGTRVALVLYLLQNYADPSPVFPGAADMLPGLRERVQAHVDLGSPEQPGLAASPAQMAAQFGHAVIIEGNLAGGDQVLLESQLTANLPAYQSCAAAGAGCDSYDMRRSAADGDAVYARAVRAVRDVSTLEQLLAVAPAKIDGLTGAARGGALRRDDTAETPADLAAAEAAMRAALGQLPAGDAYWIGYELTCGYFTGDGDSLAAFADVVRRTRTFATRAEYDAVVYAEVYPALFESVGFAHQLRTDLPVGAARPGLLQLTPPQSQATQVSIRFPKYAAGHAVAATAGAELCDDVEDWLREDGVVK